MYKNEFAVGRGCVSNRKVTLLAAALLSSLLALNAPATAWAQAAPQSQTWQLAAGPLDAALRRLAEQAQLTITYTPAMVAGKTTQGISGQYTPAEALRRLLSGTGLTWDVIDESTFSLRAAPEATVSVTTPQKRSLHSQTSSKAPNITELPEMTVTGTRIRGTQPSSPLVMITQEEMRLAGHNNLGDVIRALPQNFNGGQNPGVHIGATLGGQANQNMTGGSGLNLRGLGPDATLTLLNGVRLPYDGFSQATDVAVIPVAAIERFEVLLDGASAIYGSDAVGGVANIILKRDYSGAEMVARNGRATNGGYEQTQVSTVVGQKWNTGSILIAAETTSSGNVRASDRGYLANIPNSDLLTIYPKISQDGAIISGYQELGSIAELGLDAFYTKRSMRSLLLAPPTAYTYDPDTTIYGFAPSLKFSLSNDWLLRLHAFTGEDEAKTKTVSRSLVTGVQSNASGQIYHNRSEAAGVELEGMLMTLPAGDARISVGGGWRKVEFENRNWVTGAISTAGTGSNTSKNAYGEVYIPVVGGAQEIPFVSQLSLNGAIRYDDYDKFGSATTPKIGVLWTIVPNIDVRASWGKSFKAPRVSEQYQTRSIVLRGAGTVGIQGAPATATVLTAAGGNPDLGPERANVMTAGLVFRPSFVAGATIEVGWFDIDYKQRVVNPIPFPTGQWGQIIGSPDFEDFYISSPTAEQVEESVQSSMTFTNLSGQGFDPANVVAIFNNHFVNASRQRVRGFDADIRYNLPTANGSWLFSSGGSWIRDSHRIVTAGTAPVDTAGMVFFPPKFKGRAGVHWTHKNLSIGAIVNHLAGVWNNGVIPNRKGGSMTTTDLIFDYAPDLDVFGGVGFNLAVVNVFDKKPPYLEPRLPYYVSYDSTNYSSLGRSVSLSISKRF